VGVLIYNITGPVQLHAVSEWSRATPQRSSFSQRVFSRYAHSHFKKL
jgi:hypothetical protein